MKRIVGEIQGGVPTAIVVGTGHLSDPTHDRIDARSAATKSSSSRSTLTVHGRAAVAVNVMAECSGARLAFNAVFALLLIPFQFPARAGKALRLARDERRRADRPRRCRFTTCAVTITR